MKLHCEVSPGLAKQNTLFIHGNLASTAWWHPTRNEWTEAGSLGSGSLIFADWRGCGHNEPAPTTADAQFSISDLAQDFIELLADKNLAQVSVVGHSLGGLIALEMLILQPSLVGKVVLLDSVGATGVKFEDGMYEVFRQMSQDRALTKTVILSTISDSSRLSDTFKEQITDDAFKAVKGIGTSVLEILKSVDLTDVLRGNSTPALILHGAQDQIIPSADAVQLSRLLNHAELEFLAGVGHCWNVENPKAFVKRLREWL